MEAQAKTNVSYSQNSLGMPIVSIPTSIYTQKESRLIIIHRDTLQICIHAFLENYVEWGTTASLVVATLSMILQAVATYNESMKSKEVLLMVVYAIFATAFFIISAKLLYKHLHHKGKTINSLMSDIEKACNKPECNS